MSKSKGKGKGFCNISKYLAQNMSDFYKACENVCFSDNFKVTKATGGVTFIIPPAEVVKQLVTIGGSFDVGEAEQRKFFDIIHPYIIRCYIDKDTNKLFELNPPVVNWKQLQGCKANKDGTVSVGGSVTIQQIAAVHTRIGPDGEMKQSNQAIWEAKAPITSSMLSKAPLSKKDTTTKDLLTKLKLAPLAKGAKVTGGTIMSCKIAKNEKYAQQHSVFDARIGLYANTMLSSAPDTFEYLTLLVNDDAAKAYNLAKQRGFAKAIYDPKHPITTFIFNMFGGCAGVTMIDFHKSPSVVDAANSGVLSDEFVKLDGELMEELSVVKISVANVKNKADNIKNIICRIMELVTKS